MNLSSFLQRLPAARVLSKTKGTLLAVGAKDRFNQLIRRWALRPATGTLPAF